MVGKVLFCDADSYKDSNSVLHDGFRLGVVFKWYGKMRCCEHWSKTEVVSGSVVDVQWSKKYQKFFVQVPELNTLPDLQ